MRRRTCFSYNFRRSDTFRLYAIEHDDADSCAAANERFIQRQLSSLNIVSGTGNLSLVSDDSVDMPALLSTSFISEPFRTFDHLFWHRFDG